jgi:hypothetical protein
LGWRIMCSTARAPTVRLTVCISKTGVNVSVPSHPRHERARKSATFSGRTRAVPRGGSWLGTTASSSLAAAHKDDLLFRAVSKVFIKGMKL